MERKTVPKLEKTRDYSRFLIHNFNRDVKRTKLLEESMGEHGFDPGFPIRCVRNSGKKLRITAGHHRFHVARKMGKEIYYIVSDREIDFFDAERPVRSWDLCDWTTARMREGNKAAEYVLDYHETTGIPLATALALVGGQTDSGGPVAGAMKDGTFRVGDQTHADKVADIVGYLGDLGVPFVTNSRFVSALSQCLRAPCFKMEVFLRKAKAHLGCFERCRNVEGYMDLIESVYNHGTPRSKKVPLVFEARKACAARSCFKRKE